MSSVRMVHPELPDQPIDVDRLAVPHYANSGWVPESDLPKPADARPVPAEKSNTESESAPEKARRRTPKEAEQ